MRTLLTALVIVSINCSGAQVARPVSLTSLSGEPLRMRGSKVSIVNDGVDQVMLAASIAWINEQVGFKLVTINRGYDSTIYITEDILPYNHPDDLEVIGYEAERSILGRSTFDAPENGVISQCRVTINYFIPGPRVRRDVMRHEILHCLGLRDTSDWGDIMNGDLAGFKRPITEESKRHLRTVYLPATN